MTFASTTFVLLIDNGVPGPLMCKRIGHRLSSVVRQTSGQIRNRLDTDFAGVANYPDKIRIEYVTNLARRV